MKLQMKAWLMEEAERTGISPRGVHNRLQRGKYLHKVGIRRVNPRVVYVLTNVKN